MEELFKFLDGIRPISDGLRIHLKAILTQRLYQKGDLILREGQISKQICIILSGLIRGFDWQKEQEVTTWLMKEGDIFYSPESFIEQVPYEESIMAIENCVVLGISYDQLQETYKLFPEFNRHGRIITEIYY